MNCWKTIRCIFDESRQAAFAIEWRTAETVDDLHIRVITETRCRRLRGLSDRAKDTLERASVNDMKIKHSHIVQVAEPMIC